MCRVAGSSQLADSGRNGNQQLIMRRSLVRYGVVPPEFKSGLSDGVLNWFEASATPPRAGYWQTYRAQQRWEGLPAGNNGGQHPASAGSALFGVVSRRLGCKVEVLQVTVSLQAPRASSAACIRSLSSAGNATLQEVCSEGVTRC